MSDKWGQISVEWSESKDSKEITGRARRGESLVLLAY